MKLADVFTELAAHAERNLRELALDQRASLQRRMALQMIETRFRQMQADGIIDDAEMAELVKSLSIHQLDTSRIRALYEELRTADSTVRPNNEDTFTDAVNDLISGAIRETQRDEADLQLDIQLETGDMVNYGIGASELSSQDHKLLMNIIGNMKA